MSTNKTILLLRNISKQFGFGATKVMAVDNVSLQVHRGDIMLIKGPSGSGKTTLLTLMGLLQTPTKGKIYYRGQDVSKYSQKQRSNFRLNKIGFMFQSFNLIPSLNVYENVSITGELGKNKQTKQITDLLLNKLGIEQRRNHLPNQLSGGERQRVAIARALVNNPQIILADEPTANLDSKSGTEAMDLLCQIACEQGKTVIIVSHDERIAKSVKKIVTIEDGRLGKISKGGHDNNCKLHKIK